MRGFLDHPRFSIVLSCLVATLCASTLQARQAPSSSTSPPPSPPIRRGGFVPGQKRPPEDPTQVTRGKTLFAINCRGCHGSDLRGGDLGGPNLLRSQIALSDQHGELIVPIIHGSRQKSGMPAIGIDDADANSVAAYVRSVIETIQGQGAPPSAGQAVPSILIGNAAEGKAYFATKCAGCHSVSGDLNGLARRFQDPKKLQDTWLAGEGREDDDEGGSRTVTATITAANGEVTKGKLVHVDEFLVTIKLANGTQQTFRREGDTPPVEIHDPLKIHRNMLAEYSDKDIHDVTAYLVTLK